jgi:hypothetical protein
MYSGSTLTSLSGRLMGAHQKIDRSARRRMEELKPGCEFPTIRRILKFEGGNGPDAIKRKSPAHDEPWHYIQPFDTGDMLLIDLITQHYDELVRCLRGKDMVRSAFEAAWLAHAIVDGLTPAHHYPYEEMLSELRGGEGKETRNTIKKKILFPGDTLTQQAHNNWRYWGTKGLFTTHTAFEWGVATLIAPMRFKTRAAISEREVRRLVRKGVGPWFRAEAQNVAKMRLYDQFYAVGWTPKMARQIRRKLAPAIVKAVAIAWTAAATEAGRA